MKDYETRRTMNEMEKGFESKVEVPLIRQDRQQRIETLINEEALLPAKYLRGEAQTWIPRIAISFTHTQESHALRARNITLYRI